MCILKLTVTARLVGLSIPNWFVQEKSNENSEYFCIRVPHFNDHKLIIQLEQHLTGLEITFSNQTLSDQYMKNLNKSVFIQKICLDIMKGLHRSKRYEGKFNVTSTHFYLTIIVLIRYSGSTILLYYFELCLNTV